MWRFLSNENLSTNFSKFDSSDDGARLLEMDDPFRYSGIEIPTVVGLLKNVLTQYPDNGQILKELVQNAEDAGATTFEVVYDERNTKTRHEIIQRFIEGPALWVYNDAVFTNDDWHGIRMLSDSIKRTDLLKVGQFGLGFKSVFHFTDFVTVISGQNVLFMDPNEPDGTMCRDIPLAKLSLVLSEEDALKLWGTHLEKKHLNDGYFSGTIFWFPLRKEESKLSSNIYRSENVLRLFESFGIEASLCLTFLKSLESISIKEHTNKGAKEELLHVSLNSHNLATVTKLRAHLRNELQICQGFPENPIICNYEITVDVKKRESLSTQSFKVLQYLPPTPDHTGCQRIPLVGIAAPKSRNVDADHASGHIFCFLPLPLEDANNTNLPIQINGYFVLDQNRRHIKWRTEENHGEADADWNEALVSSILPEAYFLLLEDILKAKKNFDVDAWYRLLPNIISGGTTGRWKEMSHTVWNKLLKLPMIFSKVKGDMMFPKDVISNAELSKLPESVASSVETVLKEVGLPLVTIPKEVEVALISLDSKPMSVTPKLLRKCLRNNKMNKSWNRQHLLEYALSDGRYEDLNGIELLPLDNGNWTTFDEIGDPVYLCSEMESSVFLGAKDQIVCTKVSPDVVKHFEEMASKGVKDQIVCTKVSPDVVKHFEEMASKGLTVIQKFTAKDHLQTLLPISIAHLNKNSLDHQGLSRWLMKVWQLLQVIDLQLITDLPFLPTSENLEVAKFISLSSSIVLIQDPMNQEEKCCASALELLNINVITCLPSYIRHPDLHNYYHEFSGKGIIQAMSKALLCQPNIMKIINTFNKKRTDEQRRGLCSKMNEVHHFPSDVKELLKKLLIFKTVGDKRDVSVEEVNEMYPPLDDFPIIPPNPLIFPCNSEFNYLARRLDCIELSKEELCLCALQHGMTGKETEMVGWYVLSDQNLYQSARIRKCLQTSSFVMSVRGCLCKPSELYNPEDNFVDALLGEDLIPMEKYNKHIRILTEVGLKSVSDLPKQTLVSFMRRIQDKEMSENVRSNKIRALFGAINCRPDCFEVCQEIDCFNCVYGAAKPDGYPDHLFWATDMKLYKPMDVLSFHKYKSVVGSSFPLVECEDYENIAASFNWFQDPKMDRVIEHLDNFLKVCPSLELVPGSSYYQYLRTMYIYLNGVAGSISYKSLLPLSGVPFVLTADGFKRPSEVFYPSGKDDLQLLPYMHALPFELHENKDLFFHLGTFCSQTLQLYLQVLMQIRNYHATHEQVDVQHDLRIVKLVLEKLAPFKDQVTSDQLILPVESSLGKLEFIEIGKCAYSDQDCDWLDCDELGVRIVERSLGVPLAKALGVQSLNKHLLADEEAVMDWEQKEPLTTRIHNLLRQYRDGVAVLKELIQNADDAGATQVCLLFDNRQNLDSKQRYLTEQMKECQGPALWAYNDAKFTEEDFKNLCKLGCGTKEWSATKIGKFGLGFCSVYNLTDVPSLVSGNNYIIFDPHERYLEGNRRGVRYNFSKKMNRIMLRKLNGQFLPFQNIFNCQIQKFAEFDGTLFRFPLRTALQAIISEICNKNYSHDGMLELLSMFRQIVGQVLLFTQNVKEVKVYYLQRDMPSQKIELLYKSSWHQEVESGLNCDRYLMDSKNVLERASLLLSANHEQNLELFEFKEIFVSVISVECTEIGAQLFESEKGTFSVMWLNSWHSGRGEACDLAKQLTGNVLPLASVALPLEIWKGTFKLRQLKTLPLGFYKDSHVHCFLPLPVRANLPLHINGYFEVATDRSSILTKSEDDRPTCGGLWNSVLMKDAVLNAYINLIEVLKLEGLCLETKFSSLWPLAVDLHEDVLESDDLLAELSTVFYSTIRDQDLEVFRNKKEWYPLSRSYFLSDTFYQDHEMGVIAFEFMENFLKDSNEEIIDLPPKMLKQFGNSVNDRIISEEQFYKEYFLPYLSSGYINSEKRNKLILHVIDSRISFRDYLKNIACVPTKPNGKLIKPCNLIYPESELANLFSISDEKFPEVLFLQRDRKMILAGLGMKSHELYKDEIVERIGTVMNILCAQCAQMRSQNILDYFERHKWQTKEVASDVRAIPFIPVMCKPKDWTLSWKGDECLPFTSVACSKHPNTSNATFLIGAPDIICSPELIEIAGSTHCIHGCFLENKYSDRQKEVYETLGIVTRATNLPLEDVILQLSEYRSTIKTVCPLVLSSACFKFYHYFNVVVLEYGVDLSSLREEEILLTKKHGFVKPSLFSKLGVDCAPALFSAHHEGLNSYEHMLKSLYVKDNFSAKTVYEVLLRKYDDFGSRELPNEDIMLISKLTNILFRVSNSDIAPCGLKFPDSKAILRPVKKLCVDDGVHIERGSFKFLHEKVCYSQEMLKWLEILEKKKRHLVNSSHRMKFGQKELLTTRLKNILDNYPCDSGVLNELLQNADDAGATEIMYVVDMRSHTTEKLFNENLAPLQGPALCVFNNKGFSKKDFEGIQNLGNSSKIEDPTSTGQYGIGFNAVYHLTDAPSFITKGKGIPGNEALCLFDPLCKYYSEATHESPGVMFTNLEDFRKEYPCSFKGYPENLLVDEGTIFRFPLRKSDSIIGPQMSKCDLYKLLDKFKDDMKVVLLFLRNIQKISVSRIVDDGKIEVDYSVESQVSDEEKHAWLGKLIRKRRIMKDNIYYFLDMQRVIYSLTITDSDNKKDEWLVGHQLGSNNTDSLPMTLIEAYDEKKLMLLPQAGIGICLKSSIPFSKKVYRNFCYLPLPAPTGFSMCLNGHFVLDSARRNLWIGTSDFKSHWNDWLMKHVLAPVVGEIIKTYRQLIFPRCKELMLSEYDKKVKHYHQLLPSVKQATSDQWKEFVKWFYQYVENYRLPIFDVFIPHADDASCLAQRDSPTKCCKGKLVWHALREENAHFPLYFADKDQEHLVNILKRLGMKVGSPYVYWVLQEASINLDTVSPENVANFLLSWNENYIDRCFPSLKSEVSSTPFLSVENVCKILVYISKIPDFESKMNNMPLLVCSDKILRHFDEDNPVYLTRHVNLLPKLEKELAHKILYKSVQDSDILGKLMNVGKHFTLSVFAEKLPTVLSQKYYCNELIGTKIYLQSYENFSEQMIKNIWLYITEEVERCCRMENEFKYDWSKGKRLILATLGGWCLFPVIFKDQKYLVRIKEACKVLYLKTDDSDTFHKLPVLHFDSSINWYIPESLNLTATLSDPTSVLEILHSHWTDLASISYDLKELKVILEYFGNHCYESKLSKDKLRKLKIYRDSTGNNCSLESNFIVPQFDTHLVSNIHKLGSIANTHILRTPKSESIQRLFLYMKSDCQMDRLDIFTYFILDYIHHLTEEECIKSLEFLRDELQKTSYRDEFTPEEQCVIAKLKGTPFIRVNGVLKKASDFYDPCKVIFKAMNMKTALPKLWLKSEWTHFLNLAGIVHEVTPQMFVDFARSLTLSDPLVKEKSKVLIDYLKKNFETLKSKIEEIKEIEFLVPSLSKKLEKLLSHYKTSSGLVSFAASVPSHCGKLVWTTMSLLPSYANELINRMDVKKQVPLEELFRHICNVTAIKVDDDYVVDIMESVYQDLQNQDQSFLTKFSLADVPIIYMPEDARFVKVDMVIQNLSTEIKPYLYRTPMRYGRYMNVLQNLGVCAEAHPDHFVKVLNTIHDSSGDYELHPEEAKCMKNAMQGLTANMANLQNIAASILYLPTRKGKGTLAKSSSMFVSDNNDFMRVVCSKQSNYLLFFGLEALEISADDIIFVKKLPQGLRPRFLSEVIQEYFDKRSIEEIELDPVSVMKEFIYSQAFKVAMVRVLRHYDALAEEKDVQKCINSVKIKATKKLDITLRLDGENIGQRSKPYFVFDDGGNQKSLIFYISRQFEDRHIQQGLVDLFSTLFGISDNPKFIRTLTVMMTCIYRPQSLHECLDECDIRSLGYDGNECEFFQTNVGTYLDKDFIYLLDNTYGVFHDHEIVAMKKYIEGQVNSNEDLLYIIVKVKYKVRGCENVMFDMYAVQTGNYDSSVSEVEAYKLYKFMREKKGLSSEVRTSDFDQSDIQDLVPSYNVYQNDEELTEEEIMKKVRNELKEIWKNAGNGNQRRHMVRRIFLLWHPDKNPEKAEICTRVIQYIQSLIRRLEDGENIPDNDEPMASSSTEPPDDFYYDTFKPPFFTSGRSGHPAYSQRERQWQNDTNSTKTPDQLEAKKWMRQAEHDYQQAFYTEGKSHCWTLNMCYQAAEKALKAALYGEDCEKAVEVHSSDKTHNLSYILSLISQCNLEEQVKSIEMCVASYNSLLYPSHSGAPCDHYSSTDIPSILRDTGIIRDTINKRF